MIKYKFISISINFETYYANIYNTTDGSANKRLEPLIYGYMNFVAIMFSVLRIYFYKKKKNFHLQSILCNNPIFERLN